MYHLTFPFALNRKYKREILGSHGGEYEV